MNRDLIFDEPVPELKHYRQFVNGQFRFNVSVRKTEVESFKLSKQTEEKIANFLLFMINVLKMENNYHNFGVAIVVSIAVNQYLPFLWPTKGWLMSFLPLFASYICF
jgi:hypothetical protein